MRLLSLAAQLSDEAGTAVLAARARGYKIAEKSDLSPVTDADLVSQQIILVGLELATPDIPVISEELPASINSPAPSVFWLIDPLNGTREFAAVLDEFVVNIGLVRDRKVVPGALSAPAQFEVFTGLVGYGAWKRSEGKVVPRHVRSIPHDGAVALVSRHDAEDQRLPTTLKNHVIADTIKMGSGLKFCRVAEGKADLYARPGCTMEWILLRHTLSLRQRVAACVP